MSDYLLDVKQINKRFGGLHAVRDVNLQVRRGEIVGILGPNGAGKTTLFNLLTGFIPPDEGTVNFQGRSIRDLKPHKIVNLGVARTFQLCRPFVGMSVIENVLVGSLGPRVTEVDLGARAMHLLSEVGLAEKADTPSELLSYGDRRRLEIARALATNPRFILLDEPFAGVDPIAVIEIQRIVRFLKARGIGVLITDHNVRETLDICDRAYIINQGSVLASGSPDEIIANESVRRVYLGENFRR